MAISISQLFELTIEGILGESKRKIGERTEPEEFTASQVWDSGNFTVADNYGQKTVWQTTNGVLTTPSWILVLSDQDIIVEIANTTPNPDERMLFKVPANRICSLPSSIMGGYASNTSRLDGAALVAATDYNDISEIRVQRDAADLAGDATVRIVLIA